MCNSNACFQVPTVYIITDFTFSEFQVDTLTGERPLVSYIYQHRAFGTSWSSLGLEFLPSVVFQFLAKQNDRASLG